MKNIIFPFILILTFQAAICQITNPAYDKALAESLGGDDYGMKMYILVILKTGPNNKFDKENTDSLFRGHMENIGHMASAGKLVVAGPIKKNDKSYRGIFILNVKTFEEAKLLLAGDPAVTNHLLDTEMYEWYGSAALTEYLKTHEKIRKVKM